MVVSEAFIRQPVARWMATDDIAKRHEACC